MPHFGWTRLAYLLFVLVVLTALVQLASLGTDPRPLASESSDGVAAATPRATEEEPHEPSRTTPPTTALPAALPTSVADGLEDMATDVPGAGSPYTRHTRAPLFQRPAPTTPPASSGGAVPRVPAFGSGPVCGDLENVPSSRRMLFPLPEAYFYSYEDTWGAPRPQGGHEGTDLMAPIGTPEYAVIDGTIVPVAGANQNGWNSLGGYAVMVEAAYSVGPIEKGDLFYYAHLDRPSALKIGARVRAGQVVGYAGNTGQGPEVTRGLFPSHLHLGWYDATGSRSDVVSGAMNPYPLLEWIEANGGAVVGGSDARYCHAPQTSVPSAGGTRWPKPDSPGVRPDLDTGSDDPKPSPVLKKSQNRAGHPVDRAKQAKPPRHRAEPATQRGQDTKDRAVAAKKPQPSEAGTPETKTPHPQPPAPEKTSADPPVPPTQKPPPPSARSPHESPPSDTAAGNEHDPSDDKQQAETGEDEKEEAEEQDPRPSSEQTSPEQDPPASETTEPETTGETEAESTVLELLPETTEITIETLIETTTETTTETTETTSSTE